MEILIPILALAIPVSAIVFNGLQKVWRLRIEEANVRARALGAEGSSDVEALRADMAELRQELEEVQERLDFTERVVLQNRDRYRVQGGPEA